MRMTFAALKTFLKSRSEDERQLGELVFSALGEYTLDSMYPNLSFLLGTNSEEQVTLNLYDTATNLHTIKRVIPLNQPLVAFTFWGPYAGDGDRGSCLIVSFAQKDRECTPTHPKTLMYRYLDMLHTAQRDFGRAVLIHAGDLSANLHFSVYLSSGGKPHALFVGPQLDLNALQKLLDPTFITSGGPTTTDGTRSLTILGRREKPLKKRLYSVAADAKDCHGESILSTFSVTHTSREDAAVEARRQWMHTAPEPDHSHHRVRVEEIPANILKEATNG